ncbi:MAG TPA: alpha/beta fold hydrolase [Candidatus Eisenbacteria bacterium]|nr:alpha/beta fold hydrolase [Candidatus Eisenbacteria bacterium]
MPYRGVIFDLGGVVCGSPLHAIAAYEQARGIPAGFVNHVVVTTAPRGAWSRLERGELDLAGFFPAFEADCTAAGQQVDARAMMLMVAEAATPRPAMLEAIRRLRAKGFRVAALTNNWRTEGDDTSQLRPHFDVVVESAVEGLRKPDPRIYHLACERLGVAPEEAVFLDDIGLNLKSAKAIGMTTIKVADPDDALAELEEILGFELRSAGGPVQRVTYRTPDGIVLVGEAHGDPTAPPVVMLHGGGQTRYAWGGTAAALAAAGRHVVNIDLRGHGDSGWAPDADYSLDAFVRDLVLVARELNHPPAVVGASLGGLTALLTAGEIAPDLVSALVLVDIAPRMDPVGVDRIISFMTGNPDGFTSLEEAADAVASYLTHRPRPRDLRGLQKNLRLGADGRWRWHWDPKFITGDRRPGATRDPERLERAAKTLGIPVLLVRGRLSDIVSEEGARAFLGIVPHAEFVDVSDAGHMVAGDKNDVFTEAVVRFLVREPAPTAA